jgi:hypothetical protein
MIGQQRIDMLEEKLTPSIMEVVRKEECPTVHAAAPILHHLECLSRNTLRCFRVTLAESLPGKSITQASIAFLAATSLTCAAIPACLNNPNTDHPF